MWQELAAGPWGLLLGEADGAVLEGRRGHRMLALTLPLGSLPLQGEVGTMGQAISTGSKSSPGEGRDGNVGGGRAHSLGAVGALGKVDPYSQGCWALCPAGRLLLNQGSVWEHTGWGRATRAG